MPEGPLRVVLAVKDPAQRRELRAMLERLGYGVAGEAADGFDALEQCRAQEPDAALLDESLPLLDGLAAADALREECPGAAVVLLTASGGREQALRAAQRGVAGMLVGPARARPRWAPCLELATAHARELRRLRRELERMSERLESRSLVEKAKGRMMESCGMSEQEAYDFLRKLSQTKKLSMRRVAEILLHAGR